MKKLGVVGLLAVSASFGAGCGGAPPRTLVNPLPADQKGIAVYVAPPKLILMDTECSQDIIASNLIGPMRQALIVGGYRVVTSPEAADLTVTLSKQIEDCWAGQGLTGQEKGMGMVRINAESAGTLLLEGSHQFDWPAEFTNRLTTSLAANGIRPRGAPPAATPPPVQTAVASLPSAPPPSATAAPQPAPAPPPGLTLRAGQQRANAYALVIGIEKYRDAPAPHGARTDAQNFAELARTTLGVPADQVIVALDDRATKSDIETKLAWLSSNVPAGGRVYFFFAGHGAPDPASASAFLLPHDGDPKAVGKTGISVSSVMSELGATKAQEVVAFVDTCYSGAGGRSVLPPGARALIKVVEPTADRAPRVALFSSAGASEISGPIAGGNEGLFTHLLVEGIGTGGADIDGDGNISLAEVAQWVKPRVSRQAKKDSRDQTPTLTVGKAAGNPDALILVQGIAK